MAGNSTGGSLIDNAKLKQLYATMLRCRLLTEHARGLRNQGRKLYASSKGQEAIAVGCVIDLRLQDTVALAPHDSIAGLVKGVALGDLVAQLYARGSTAGISPYNILSPSAKLCANQGEQLATDVALANKQKKNGNVVVAFTNAHGTATSYARGCWDQALKSAARNSLPIIFVVENNPWPRAAGSNLSLKVPKGFTSITVDANDVVAVYRVAHESLERVRQGGGPVLVEGKPYRQDGKALPTAERDPLLHMERYLRTKRLFTTRWKDQIVHHFSLELDTAVKATRYLRASQSVAND